MHVIETGLKRIQVNLRGNEQSPEATAARHLLRDHYSGANTAIFLDKDETLQAPDASLPSNPSVEQVFAEGEKRGVLSGLDSNSSPADLNKLGLAIGLGGVHVAEKGALVTGLENGRELQLVKSGFWLNNLLLNQFAQTIHNDPDLSESTAIIYGDPWAIINDGGKIPGSKKQVVMLNSGRHASAGMVTGLLDSEGNIIRKTDESKNFFQKMADIFLQTRDRLNEQIPFPDSEGMETDRSEAYEVVNIVSRAANKRTAMEAIQQTLGIPVIHIGDSEQDNMEGIKNVTTMAVGNNTLRNMKGVIAADAPMASGVVELYSKHILPFADKLKNPLPEPIETAIARYEEFFKDVARKVLRIDGVPMVITYSNLKQTITIQEGDEKVAIPSYRKRFNTQALSTHIKEVSEALGYQWDIGPGGRCYTEISRLSRDGKREVGSFWVAIGRKPAE